MANASQFSPTNKHFFQPLLTGFQSNLNIPVKFFSEHIEGKHEGKTVTLRSDASERTWEVKMEGHRLTKGWKDFVEMHDLRIGDIVVFRHEGDMVFHVTALGPSCCEIQYPQSSSHEEGEESGEIKISEKEVEENVQKESDQSSPDLNCFSQTVTHSYISRDKVTLPKGFAKRNGLDKGMHEILLMNEEGKSWKSKVKSNMSRQVYIVGGWRSFCTENKLKVGDICTFKLLQNAKTPVFQLCSRTGESQFVKLTPTLNSLEIGKQHLPVSFTKVNGLINPGKITLVDKDRVEWSMKLRVDTRGGMYIFGGTDWKSFCAANEVGKRESLTLKLIRGGLSPLLKFCSKMEPPSVEAEGRTHKRARVQNGSHETDKGEPSRASMGPELEIREKTAEKGEPSRASNKSRGNQGNLQKTQPCSVTDQVAKVKESVLDTLTSTRRFQAELEIMERKLEDSLQEINKLERGEDNIFKL